MTELNKVEKLREKADVTYAEAKEALDASGGSLLDALILLENQGKVTTPPGGGFYSGADLPVQTELVPLYNSNTGSTDSGSGESFADLMRRFGDFCLKMFNKGLNNHLIATKGNEQLFTCPVLVVIVLTIFFFWITIVLFAISLLFGFRYRFSGDDLGRESVNSVMDSASDVAEDIKKSFVDSVNKTDEKDEQNNE